jgi:dihydroorotate dehydrogenase electron transfer subunit
MLDKKTKIKEIRDLGGRNYLMTFSSPEQARFARPGQFFMLKCSPGLDDHPLLRRPLSVFDIHRHPRTDKPAGIDLLVKDVGSGTHRLVGLPRGTEIYMLGPQGKPFHLTPEMKHRVSAACLVAGGVGIAALYLLARSLLALEVKPILFYGGRRAEDLVLREYFERIGVEIVATTEDGSCGERGLVTAPLERFLSSRPQRDLRVYACGPWGMMKAAHEIAARYRLPCEVSLEARMGCSLGACMGCVVHAKDDAGEEQYLRVCLEGPVMSSHLIDWDSPPI